MKTLLYLIYFFSSLNFYDNEIILCLILYYKNKTSISSANLKQQISNEKFKISLYTKYSKDSSKYLNNECNKNDINM